MSIPFANRLVLVPDPRPMPARPTVRRYRLARLDLRGSASQGDRFEHIRRVYD
jgi:hypothetical protein